MKRLLLQAIAFLALSWPAEAGKLRRRLNERCRASENARMELTQDFLVKTLHAAQLSALTYTTHRFHSPEKGDFETMVPLVGWDDNALVARRNNVCYAAFRGTWRYNPTDVLQIIDGRERILNGCSIRAGYHRAYFAGYYEKFLQAVDECMESGTELILTGHSQGGGVAMVAFIDLQHYNPTAITFGALKALLEPCASIDSTKIYRFTNVGYQLYDYFSNWEDMKGAHMGHSIMLDINSTAGAVYLGLDEDVTRSPSAIKVHKSGRYWEALNNLARRSVTECEGDLLQLRGFEEGHWCTYDDECNGVCNEGFCEG